QRQEPAEKIVPSHSEAEASSHGFAQREYSEKREHELAPPPPRLAYQSVQPLEVQPPHPGGSAGRVAGQIIEDTSNADTYRDTQRSQVAIEPMLLFGGAVGDQEDVYSASLTDGGPG